MASQEWALSNGFYTTGIFKAHSTVYCLRGLFSHSETLKKSKAVMDTVIFRVAIASRERVDITRKPEGSRSIGGRLLKAGVRSSIFILAFPYICVHTRT